MIRDVLYAYLHRLFSVILHTWNMILHFVLWFCFKNSWKCFWITLYFLCTSFWRLWRFAHSYFSDLWTRELWCNRQIRQNQEFSNVLRQFGPDDFNKHSVPLLKKTLQLWSYFQKLYFTWMTKIRLILLKLSFILLRKQTLVI